MNWTSANSYCETTYGTMLATITSSDEDVEARAAATNAGISETSSIWIGFNDMVTEDTWVWIDGTLNTTYAPWNTNEPNDSGDCGQQYGTDKSNLWDDTGCKNTKPFVCNYGYYIGVNSETAWDSANSYCSSTYDSELATIVTNAQNNLVRYYATQAGIPITDGIWIGLTDEDTEDTWVWVETGLSTVDTGYAPWNTNEPNNSGDRGQQYGNSRNNLWDDTGNTGPKAFVCNVNPPTTSPSNVPSSEPSDRPSDHPTSMPTTKPSDHPSSQPSGHPTDEPTDYPSNEPSSQPSDKPSGQPTVLPSNEPSSKPSSEPSILPTAEFEPSYVSTRSSTSTSSTISSTSTSRASVTQNTRNEMSSISTSMVSSTSSSDSVSTNGGSSSDSNTSKNDLNDISILLYVLIFLFAAVCCILCILCIFGAFYMKSRGEQKIKESKTAQMHVDKDNVHKLENVNSMSQISQTNQRQLGTINTNSTIIYSTDNKMQMNNQNNQNNENNNKNEIDNDGQMALELARVLLPAQPNVNENKLTEGGGAGGGGDGDATGLDHGMYGSNHNVGEQYGHGEGGHVTGNYSNSNNNNNNYNNDTGNVIQVNGKKLELYNNWSNWNADDVCKWLTMELENANFGKEKINQFIHQFSQLDMTGKVLEMWINECKGDSQRLTQKFQSKIPFSKQSVVWDVVIQAILNL